MSTAQCLGLPARARRRDSARNPPRLGAGIQLGAIFGLLTLLGAGGLSAQTRGDLQVGAHVLPAGPSQAALALALNWPSMGSHPELADIRRQLRSAPSDSAGAALPPESVVTIAFLRN
ncbi:MAG: hypothetical protein ABI742_11970 [Gemmatimonadota bacterium]